MHSREPRSRSLSKGDVAALKEGKALNMASLLHGSVDPTRHRGIKAQRLCRERPWGRSANHAHLAVVKDFLQVRVPEAGNFARSLACSMEALEAQLKPNTAGVMVLVNGHRASFGVIEVRNGHLLFFTGKGLREIFKPSTPNEEKAAPALQVKVDAEAWEELKRSGHVAEVPLARIISLDS